VYDDPETLFDVQYNNPSTGTTVQTAVGEECDWTVASPGGSTQTGLSNTFLTAIQATSGQFQITGFGYEINDSLTDAYVVVSVRINEHHYKAAVNSV
jgi:gentisate 1,2-dioxygenase